MTSIASSSCVGLARNFGILNQNVDLAFYLRQLLLFSINDRQFGIDVSVFDKSMHLTQSRKRPAQAVYILMAELQRALFYL